MLDTVNWRCTKDTIKYADAEDTVHDNVANFKETTDQSRPT